MACLRGVEGVTRRDKIRNKEIIIDLQLTEYQINIIDRIQNNRLMRYFGDLTRMQDEKYHNTACSGYVRGVRKRGRSKKRWFDTIWRTVKNWI